MSFEPSPADNSCHFCDAHSGGLNDAIFFDAARNHRIEKDPALLYRDHAGFAACPTCRAALTSATYDELYQLALPLAVAKALES